MALKNISPRTRYEVVEFFRNFHWRGDNGAGFSFDCDKDGNVDVEAMHPYGRENYAKCLSGEYDVVDLGVNESRRTVRVPARGECRCGRIVNLANGLDNECECGRCYNSSGSEVVPSWKCDEQGEPYD